MLAVKAALEGGRAALRPPLAVLALDELAAFLRLAGRAGTLQPALLPLLAFICRRAPGPTAPKSVHEQWCTRAGWLGQCPCAGWALSGGLLPALLVLQAAMCQCNCIALGQARGPVTLSTVMLVGLGESLRLGRGWSSQQLVRAGASA